MGHNWAKGGIINNYTRATMVNGQTHRILGHCTYVNTTCQHWVLGEAYLELPKVALGWERRHALGFFYKTSQWDEGEDPQRAQFSKILSWEKPRGEHITMAYGGMRAHLEGTPTWSKWDQRSSVTCAKKSTSQHFKAYDTQGSECHRQLSWT